MTPLDLTTVPLVKQWLAANGMPSVNDTDDSNIQLCITSQGMTWLISTGNHNRNNSVPTESLFNQVVTFTQTYNGNGKQRMYLHNTPVISIISLIVNGVTIPQSTAWNQVGWVIDDDGKSVWIRQGGGNTINLVSQYVLGQLVFNKGIQNVTITYTAGFAEQTQTNELQTIPATPGPYTLFTDEPLLQIGSVSYFIGGAPLTQVFLAPSAGQFFLNTNGSLVFNAADQGAQVLVTYEMPGTPPDVQMCATEMVALNYKRKQWIDQKSQSMAHGVGTITFRDWEFPPHLQRILTNYKRTALV